VFAAKTDTRRLGASGSRDRPNYTNLLCYTLGSRSVYAALHRAATLIGNEPAGYIKVREFLEYLCDYCFLEMECQLYVIHVDTRKFIS
jgi:hypothetical protein